MKIGILKYPGGHGEVELMQALTNHFNSDVREIWYMDGGPFHVDLLFLTGGFPCKEQSQGYKCFHDSPALQYLAEFAALGKYIAGFGNSFQLLCEAGLLPGMLEKNINGNFICKQVYLKQENHNNAFTKGLNQDRIFKIPIATKYGKFEADDRVLTKMRQDGQILFRFCDYAGRITEAVNYTGSMDNIAMVCNAAKNVFGMIPQPERAISPFAKDADGKILLKSFLDELGRYV